MNKLNELNKMVPLWWLNPIACKGFCEWFTQHTLRAILSVNIDGSRKDSIYSGFLYAEENSLIWFTAGHVIDEIKYVLENHRDTIQAFRWFDGLCIEGAEAVPIHDIDHLEIHSLSKYSIDVGLIFIHGFDKSNLLQNKNLMTLNKNVWSGTPTNVIGYYLIGYPTETVKIMEQKVGNKTYVQCKSEPFCIPIEQVNFNINNPEFYDDPNNFYGKIRDECLDTKLQSIKGMSGSPVFSLELSVKNELRYHLIGVERGWDERSRIIKVEEFNNLYNKLVLLNGKKESD